MVVAFVVGMGSTRTRQIERQAAVSTKHRFFIQVQFALRKEGTPSSEIREQLIEPVLQNFQPTFSCRKTPQPARGIKQIVRWDKAWFVAEGSTQLVLVIERAR